MMIKHSLIYKSKRYMTLFEVLIALSLLSVLLAILFGFFQELTVLNLDSKKNLKESFQARYAENRLFYIFSNLVQEVKKSNGDNKDKNSRTFYFYTLKDDVSKFPSLIFTFDNGSVLDPYLGGDVLGRLFVDNDKHLVLAVAALKSEKEQTENELLAHVKLEYLMDHVENISFQFLSAPDAENTVNSTTKKSNEAPKGEWVADWEKSYNEMPVILKMVVEVSNDAAKGVQKSKNDSKNTLKEFSFVLPSTNHPIIFKSK